MLSSALADSSDGGELSCNVFGCGVWPLEVAPLERSDASSEADDSGTGGLARALGVNSVVAGTEGGGAAGGAGSLARGALTEVSPVNGFLYSVSVLMTSSAVGL
jgi:hypothetical protein